MNPGYGYWPSEWMGIFPILMPILLLTILFTFLYLCLGHRRYSSSGETHSNCCSGHKSDTALSFLKERYAKGEISLEEFEKIKKIIIS